MQYKKYLKTEHWRNRRRIFIDKAHKRCWLCRSRMKFDIHHKRYRRQDESVLFKEKHTDMRRLCQPCHKKVHKLGLESYLANGKVKRRELRDFVLGV